MAVTGCGGAGEEGKVLSCEGAKKKKKVQSSAESEILVLE